MLDKIMAKIEKESKDYWSEREPLSKKQLDAVENFSKEKKQMVNKMVLQNSETSK